MITMNISIIMPNGTKKNVVLISPAPAAGPVVARVQAKAAPSQAEPDASPEGGDPAIPF